ncbi:fungal-specific transcription factor domain-containing protein [Lophiotrema nucula]|uniref:Fungal-specific transcription factor domain-containing protein n=1 Tax=Lophiotrema nucula TaxID=690887 RepID=A0A6A5ZBH2_9PLEO|nr:fungal-specific transcription factor domain-containing protein [Lophiotrema nucula]
MAPAASRTNSLAFAEEFCVVPLSLDCRTNPFRVHTNRIAKFSFLLHAILAVSSQHLAKKNHNSSLNIEMHRHSSTALKLFSKALIYSDIVSLLETILVIVNLETSQTASSTWSIHLNGAQGLLERDSAVESHVGNSRMVAQIAIVVWWDVTIAFISRREPSFPMSYLDMLATQDTGESWSFIVLNGCPIEFVIAMTRLAKLAAIYTKTTRMDWTIFNTFPVEVIIDEVKDYVNQEKVDIDHPGNLDEDPNARRNRFHCIEAWRHAILLYAYRVFAPNQEEAKLRLISHLARVVLDSVRCIPREDTLRSSYCYPYF